MVKGLPDMEGWGLLAMCKEVNRLLRNYARLLHPFLLAFLLPVAIILFLEIVGIAWLTEWLVRHGPNPRFGGMFGRGHHHHSHFSSKAFSAFSEASDGNSPLPPIVLRVVLLTFALDVVIWILESLAAAAIAKVVQCIYSHDENDPDIVKSIFSSLPGAFLRILVTSFWIVLLELFLAFLVSLPMAFLSEAPVNFELLIIVTSVVLFVALLVVELLFLVSMQVAVLEPENYGLATLNRSVKLVQTKVPAAVVLVVVQVVFSFCLGELVGFTSRIPIDGQLPSWLMYVLALAISFLFLAFATYWLVLLSVFYFASQVQSGAEEHVLPQANPYQPLARSTANEETRYPTATG